MTATPRPPSKQPKARLFFALALILVLGLVAQRWWWGRSHVSSDNAQLEGHIVPIAARVGGYVLKVSATDNQPVTQGELLLEIDPRDYAVKLNQAEADYHQALAATGIPESMAQLKAYALLSLQIGKQAQMLSFATIFLLFGLAMVGILPLLFLMKKQTISAGSDAH